jgi:hypothetical protein
MRLLFAIAVTLLVALVATPTAHAGSLPRSMPRTLGAPPAMERCIEAPISLAFDVIENEAARFAAPETLTSRTEGIAQNLRTPANVETPRPARLIRLAAAPLPSQAKKSGVSCGRIASHAVCARSLDSDMPSKSSSNTIDDLWWMSPRDRSSLDLHAFGTRFAAPKIHPWTAADERERDAHTRSPWRPPCR